MRFSIFVALYFSSAALAFNLPETKRGLADAIDPLQGPTEQHIQAQETRLEHTTERATETHPSGSPTGTLSLPALLSSLESSARSKETSTASHTQSTSGVLTASTAPTSSITQPTPSAPPITSSIQPTTAYTSIVLPTPSPSKPSGGQSISRGSQEWKIIGVAVIAFSTVAAILLLSVFFDQWWGFIRDLVWRKKAKDRYEEFVPDWEKASWEIKQDGEYHRYPTLPSPTKNRAPELDMEKGFNDPFHAEYMTGVGSGFASNKLYAPQPTYNAVDGLGILTPIPPAHYPSPPARAPSLNRSKSQRHASVAMTDPYSGIE